jgi:hypothetical protein
MKLHERYSKFNDPTALKTGVVRSVYASMALENQTVSQSRIGELYDQQHDRQYTGLVSLSGQGQRR